jgi:phosphatidylglycerophosphatase A
MDDFPNLKNPFHFLATLGGIGNIPLAPGTFGSIFSWLIFIFLSHFVNMFYVTFIGIFLSIWICEMASKNLIHKDHRSIVIDELIGIWIALLPVLYLADTQKERIVYAIAALLFFRLFDIFKPFPVSYFDENFKNGAGIVIDDLSAGVMAIIPSYIILTLLT